MNGQNGLGKASRFSIAPLVTLILRFFFRLLYHQFAWGYDFIAATVSFGNWSQWVSLALPHLTGRVLELGFGPGHLQVSLNGNGLTSFGLDESRQMASLAGRRLGAHHFPSRLARGHAQHLPFPAGAFNSVAATFPSEYIFDPLTLKEVVRVLAHSGQLVILPFAWINGKKLPERLLAWLFRVTGETPDRPGFILENIKGRIKNDWFDISEEMVELKGSKLLVIIAMKK
jgi:ubiquinone/menaquinone biosynthesis C-methylase UbiE